MPIRNRIYAGFIDSAMISITKPIYLVNFIKDHRVAIRVVDEWLHTGPLNKSRSMPRDGRPVFLSRWVTCVRWARLDCRRSASSKAISQLDLSLSRCQSTRTRWENDHRHAASSLSSSRIEETPTYHDGENRLNDGFTEARRRRRTPLFVHHSYVDIDLEVCRCIARFL